MAAMAARDSGGSNLKRRYRNITTPAAHRACEMLKLGSSKHLVTESTSTMAKQSEAFPILPGTI